VEDVSYTEHHTTGHVDRLWSDDGIIVETLTTPSTDRSVAVVITITLVLTLIIAVSGAEGMAASLVLCAMCAGLAKVKAAGRFWTWLPAACTVMSGLALIVHMA
jgi:hypothetical protein